MAGLIHIYCGDGKGKTTAAIGLAIRAAGAGRKVLFAQFLKDGSSSELKILRNLENIEVLTCETRYGFYKNMNEETRERARADYSALFERVVKGVAGEPGLLVLDEIIPACRYGFVSEERFISFLAQKPEGLEVVLTGRDPSAALLETADYVTEMHKVRHPFDRGVAARSGIEY